MAKFSTKKSNRDVIKRVEKLKRQYPEKTNHELAQLLIDKKAKLCATTGAITAAPAGLPGIGTLLAVIGGGLIDIGSLSYLMSELALELSLLYRRDLEIPSAHRESIIVLVSALGAGKKISKVVIDQMTTRGMLNLSQRLLVSIGIKVSQRSILKIFPIIGMLLSGILNYYLCQKVGKKMMDYYEQNISYDNGEVIDV